LLTDFWVAVPSGGDNLVILGVLNNPPKIKIGLKNSSLKQVILQQFVMQLFMIQYVLVERAHLENG
jgi:hypothetical protein